MVSQGSAIHPAGLKFHSCFGIRQAMALMFALVLFVAIAPVPLFSSSEMPPTATLGKRAPISKSVVAASYGKLPLSFEINQGQTDPRVKFLSRGSGYSLFLTGSEAVLSLRKSSLVSKTEASFKTVSFKRQSRLAKARPFITESVVRMKLIGANSNAKISGLEELPSKSNYFIGNDPTKWRNNVPNYAKVKYTNIYPGIDLVYYGNQQRLECDFILAPAADPRRIELRFVGAKQLRLDAAGNLVVSLANGDIIEHAPVIYQDLNGIRQLVAGGYDLRSRHKVRLKLGSYDHQEPLTIDPTLTYSTELAGNGGSVGQAITVDLSGNAYITGYTAATGFGFPLTHGAFQIFNRGETSAFVSKLNSSGSGLIYSTYLGGSFDNQGFAIAVDLLGNAYVTGYTDSTDFPTTPGAFQSTIPERTVNAFVTKLNSTGSALVYSTYLGGSAQDEGDGIALDSSDSAYVTGHTFGDFPTTPGAFQTTYGGGFSDAFVTKLNAAGSALVYSTYLGGSGADAGAFAAIAVDASGNAYVTGDTTSSDFPITTGAFQTTLRGNADAFVTKLNSNGSSLAYSTYLGGSEYDQANGIALDASRNAYVTGRTSSSDFPTSAGAFQTTLGGNSDAFVSKLNGSGSALVYSTYLGGGGAGIALEGGTGIAVDTFGDAYVTGVTGSSNFPTTANAFQTTYGGGEDDAFITKLNSSGSALEYSSYLGGESDEVGSGIALDISGDAYVAGFTDSRSFPATKTIRAGSLQEFPYVFAAKVSLGTGLLPFSHLSGSLKIDPDAGVFYLWGGFTLGSGGSIDPTTQEVTFSVGSYAVTLPPGSFVKSGTGYVYQKTVNGIFLCILIEFTRYPGNYQLLANRTGGTLNGTTSPVPVTLTISDNSGSTQMNATFY